jgi:hypothetical protein
VKKEVWHTDIVVSGQGMNLKVKSGKTGCFALSVMPDVPGKPSRAAEKRFIQAYRAQPPVCQVTAVKRRTERAIKKTRARWNGWHKEAY